MVQKAIRRLVAGLSPQRLGFETGSDYEGFAVDRLAPDRFSFEFFVFSLSISFHRGSSYSYLTWETNNSPIGCRSSETSSHPIDMNKKKREWFVGNLFYDAVSVTRLYSVNDILISE
jgi:hypothetical protein